MTVADSAEPPGPRRLWAVGGVVGPVAFIGAWAVAGIRRDGYSATDEAISELAAVGAPDRGLMTLGFLAFALGVGLCAVGCGRLLPGWSWVALALAAVATVGAAAFPLSGDDVDVAHGAFAAAGYVFLVAAPFAALPGLAGEPCRVWRRRSVAVGSLAAASLVVSVGVEANGLFQRVGLTLVDGWIVAVSAAVLRRPFRARCGGPRPER